MTQSRTSLYALLITVLLLSACEILPADRTASGPQVQQGPTPTPLPTPIVPIKPVYEVARGDVVKSAQFNGRVAPVVEQELFFRNSGWIRDVYIERNTPVTAGQVLADLEIDNLERELASKLLDLEQAEQDLKEAERSHADTLARSRFGLERAQIRLTRQAKAYIYDLAEAEAALTIRRLDLAKALNQSPQDRLIVAAADLNKAHITLRSAQEKYDAIAYADTVGSSSQAIALQQATIEFERLEATYNLAKKQIDNEVFDIETLREEIALAELEVERLKDIGLDPELEQYVIEAQFEVEVLERGVDPIYANRVKRSVLEVEKLQAAIADSQIVAPFDGTVLSESLSEGLEVTGFRPLVIIGDLRELEISADPSDTILRELETGMRIVATWSSRPGEEFPGEIRRLPYPYGGGGRSEGVEEDTSTRIMLEAPFDELNLEMGDLMVVTAVVEGASDALWLPPQAVRTFDGRKFVVIQDGEAQRRVDVKVGIESEDRVEIIEGVTDGQLVLGP